MVRMCQILQIIFAIVFIILTLGFISVELEWADGSRFKYRGWKLSKNVLWFLLCLFVVVVAALLRVN